MSSEGWLRKLCRNKNRDAIKKKKKIDTIRWWFRYIYHARVIHDSVKIWKYSARKTLLIRQRPDESIHLHNTGPLFNLKLDFFAADIKPKAYSRLNWKFQDIITMEFWFFFSLGLLFTASRYRKFERSEVRNSARYRRPILAAAAAAEQPVSHGNNNNKLQQSPRGRLMINHLVKKKNKKKLHIYIYI